MQTSRYCSSKRRQRCSFQLLVTSVHRQSPRCPKSTIEKRHRHATMTEGSRYLSDVMDFEAIEAAARSRIIDHPTCNRTHPLNRASRSFMLSRCGKLKMKGWSTASNASKHRNITKIDAVIAAATINPQADVVKPDSKLRQFEGPLERTPGGFFIWQKGGEAHVARLTESLMHFGVEVVVADTPVGSHSPHELAGFKEHG